MDELEETGRPCSSCGHWIDSNHITFCVQCAKSGGAFSVSSNELIRNITKDIHETIERMDADLQNLREQQQQFIESDLDRLAFGVDGEMEGYRKAMGFLKKLNGRITRLRTYGGGNQ